jgi:hypothetical protein
MAVLYIALLWITKEPYRTGIGTSIDAANVTPGGAALPENLIDYNRSQIVASLVTTLVVRGRTR